MNLLYSFLDPQFPFIHDWIAIAAAPLAGRLAFAGVFMAVIAWLLWIPTGRLQAEANGDEAGQAPSVTVVRYSAVAIATIQVLLYLLWS